MQCVTKNIDSSCSIRVHIKEKKKDIFQQRDSEVYKDVHQATIFNSLKKKDSCMSVNLKVRKKKIPWQLVRTVTGQLVTKQMISVILEVLKYL